MFNPIDSLLESHAKGRKFTLTSRKMLLSMLWVYDICIITYSFSSKFQSHTDIDTIILFISIFETFYALGMLFFVCELAQQMSIAFEGINNTFHQINWHLFPIDAQKLLPIILINVQRPVNFNCFGGILCCNRETFKKVRSIQING